MVCETMNKIDRIKEIETSLRVAKRIHKEEKEKLEFQQTIVYNGQKYIESLEAELYTLRYW